MTVKHRLIGYDRRTDRMKQSFDVADQLLPAAKRIAHVPEDDPEAAWSYPLANEQVRQVADLIGAEVDPESAEFFLEAFADA
jgi:hypothetical protein